MIWVNAIKLTLTPRPLIFEQKIHSTFKMPLAENIHILDQSIDTKLSL